MITLAKQTIDFFTTKMREPKLEELDLKNQALVQERGCVFVTVYDKWEIRGSAGNIKEIEQSLAEETIKSTIQAISADSRFKPLTKAEAEDIRIRVDKITNRKVLEPWSVALLDPVTHGIIVIKKDYSKLVTILPNISPAVLTSGDLVDYLEAKLWEKFVEKDCIVYQIETEVLTNY